MSLIKLSWKKDIATVTFSPEKSRMNVLDKATLDHFEKTVEQILAKESKKGVILTSSIDSFIAGVDLKMLGHMINPHASIHENRKQVLGFVWELDQLFRRLETAGCPVVSAITGTALGGGYELCLATHHRIMIDNPNSRIGLPETQLGIFPGLGGTVRLTRLLGVEKALRHLIPGKTYSPKKALTAGLIDSLAKDRDDLLKQAEQWITDNPEAIQPWDERKYRMPGGAPYSPQGLMTWSPACALTKVKTANLYPAIGDMLTCIYRGCLVTFDQAMNIEAKHFVHQLLTPQAQRMIKTLFIARQTLRQEAKSPSDIKKIAVYGAGFMGSGIATVLASHGCDVLLFDNDLATVKQAKQLICQEATKLVEKGIKDKTYLQKLEKNLTPTDQLKELKSVHCIIEAVFEDIKVKAAVFKTICQYADPSCLIVSNTSTLPISSLQKHVPEPGRFCGMHFFSPVTRMNLVEVIPGKQTSHATEKSVMSLAASIGKTPIMVSDVQGFFVNQVLMAYLEQAYAMLANGVPPYLIEKAAKQIGMPVGPLALSDEVGIDVIWYILQSFGGQKDSPAASIIGQLFHEKRYGKKASEGFYDYQGNSKKLKHWDTEMERSPISFQDIKDRLFYAQMLKSAELFDEGVIQSPCAGDYAAIFGWGFCPWTGGPFRYFDDLHRQQFIKKCKDLADKYGQCFHTPDILQEWADDSTMKFYQTDQESTSRFI